MGLKKQYVCVTEWWGAVLPFSLFLIGGVYGVELTLCRYYLVSDSRFNIHNNGTLVVRNIADDVVGTYACRISDGNTVPQVERYSLQLKGESLSHAHARHLPQVRPCA